MSANPNLEMPSTAGATDATPVGGNIESSFSKSALNDFDCNSYWLDRGGRYIKEKRLQESWFRQQEQFLLEIIQPIQPESILELGCGYGRMTRVIAEAMPETQILGLDLSPDQIANARAYCADYPTVGFMEKDLLQLGSMPFRFDLVLAVEFFLHVPDEALEKMLRVLMPSCGVLIHDFDVNPSEARSKHVFPRDYLEFYASMGWKAEMLVREPYGAMVVRG